MAPRVPLSPVDGHALVSRRDLLKLGALVAGGAAASTVAACAPRRDAEPSTALGSTTFGTGAPSALAGPVTMIAGGGDPMAEPALRKVFDDFATQHPGLSWDVRALPGGGPEWDRLARALLASGEPVDVTMINGQQLRSWARDGLLADLSADPHLADVLPRVPPRFQIGGPGETATRALLASGEPVDVTMINGQQLRSWARDGLLADLSADPHLADVLPRVPPRFQIGGPGETATRAFPLAMSRGVETTGLYYNKALLDQAGVGVPKTIADLRAMVAPLSRVGAAPLVHCSGDVFFNQILLTWILPMVVERSGGDPHTFADSTVKGDIGYDSPEWLEAFTTIGELRTNGVILEGSGATDYLAMQQLFLQGKAAATFQGTWMLPSIQAAKAPRPFDVHVAPPPLIDGAKRPRPILAWAGFALPATSRRARDAAYAFLEYASRPEVDREVTAGSQNYSPIAASNDTITNPVAREFLPLFDDAISPLDWLWEPEITAEIDSQVQALVKGITEPARAGAAVQAVAEDLRATGRSYYR